MEAAIVAASIEAIRPLLPVGKPGKLPTAGGMISKTDVLNRYRSLGEAPKNSGRGLR